MAKINQSKCVGCKICIKYCAGDAIHFDGSKCSIDENECTECYVCLRQKVCPNEAIEVSETDNFYKEFKHMLSDPVENHPVTGVTGRGTEEVKTNDVSGRVRRGEAGFCIDMGRPGIGTFLYDVEKVAMAVCKAGLNLTSADKSPLGTLTTDIHTGKLKEECLGYKLLSIIIEGKCSESKIKDVLLALKEVEDKIDTVFSVGIILRVDENGHNNALECLNDIGIPKPYRGKVNVGLGRPLIND